MAEDLKTTSSWQDTPERGSRKLIRFSLALVLIFGRTLMKPLVTLLAFYFTLTSKTARIGINALLRRVGHRPGFWAAYRSIRTYAQTLLDAVFLLRGETKAMRFEHHEHHLLREAEAAGKGAVLLGAHFGSFYAMRGRSKARGLNVHPVMYLKNAQGFTSAMQAVAPDFLEKIVRADEGDTSFLLKLRDIVERGEFVAIMADRVSNEGKTVDVELLGDTVTFPTGPFLIASMLRCPVLFVAGVYEAPNVYHLRVRKLFDPLVLPRGDREAALQAAVQQYADVLGEFAATHPNNWFNFFDLWSA